ncbi:Por secretion system C-terminal sorting domain-containing protein [Saccharicrinis carchari]|uniref:Por secretion system C-terminal sorting domain-containing protein n=1 Tax=Saccharicrinis carchari TaxID=1168039 RepID=A0A521CI07_SACCC|nr:endonuclease [Saccharicrinis carchari]SMO59087.1 Por secretion system C-terminal sorting domain-containing protein [Saccharicrinis carchari]
MKNIYLLIFLFLMPGLNLSSQTDIEQYYAPAQGKTGTELRQVLHAIISNNTQLTYSQARDSLKVSDEDPNNSENVLLLYSGWSYPKNNFGPAVTEWNREHTWAKSMGGFGTEPGPGTDIHHLRPTDVSVNSARGNLYFDDGGNPYRDGTRYGGGSGATGCFYDSDSWEPRDAVKGDVARMMFYMDVRYEGGGEIDLILDEYSSSTGRHGKLSTLLQWHIDDPVDQWELDRNERVFVSQGNRNPFINHPEFVALIWDGSGNHGGNDYTELFKEDFETRTLGKMTQFSVVDEAYTWYADSYSNNWFAKMSGFTGSGNVANEDWLINQTAVNLNGYEDLFLSFISSMNIFGGNTSFTIHISSDYDGTSNPNGFTWTDVTSQATLSTDNYDRVPSGAIDLMPWANESVYVGFKFVNTANGSNTWQVDDIKIMGKAISSSLTNNALHDVCLYPNPAKSRFSVLYDGAMAIEQVRIFNLSGLLQKTVSSYQNNSAINLSGVAKGVYLVQIKGKDGSCVVKKLVVN